VSVVVVERQPRPAGQVPSISAVIIVDQAREQRDIRACIRTLRAVTSDVPDLEIVLLGVGPGAESVAAAQDEAELQRVVRAPELTDFAQVPRLVLEHARADYVLHIWDLWDFGAFEYFLDAARVACEAHPDLGCLRLTIFPWTWSRSPRMTDSEVRPFREGMDLRVFTCRFRGLPTDFANQVFLSRRDRYEASLPPAPCSTQHHLGRAWGFAFHGLYSVGFFEGRSYGGSRQLNHLAEAQRIWISQAHRFKRWKNPLLDWLAEAPAEEAAAHELFLESTPRVFPTGRVVRILHDGAQPVEDPPATYSGLGERALRVTQDVIGILALCDGARTVQEVCAEVAGENSGVQAQVARLLLKFVLRGDLLLPWAPLPGEPWPEPSSSHGPGEKG
jgi:hypothetical protein